MAANKGTFIVAVKPLGKQQKKSGDLPIHPPYDFSATISERNGRPKNDLPPRSMALTTGSARVPGGRRGSKRLQASSMLSWER